MTDGAYAGAFFAVDCGKVVCAERPSEVYMTQFAREGQCAHGFFEA